MISRSITRKIVKALNSDTAHKVICLFGARQVGKTTLLQGIFNGLGGRKEFLNGDFVDDRALLIPERAPLQRLAGHLDYLFIDEAQNVPSVGLVLKLLHDTYPELRIVASGSAAFDLRRKTGEPLTGRQIVFELFPISLAELRPRATNLMTWLEHGMLFGGYPNVVTAESPEDKKTELRQLAADYLLKDIFAQVDLNRNRLHDLLRLLAFQIGSEVSLNELAAATRMDVKTVDRYLGFLEDAYVLQRLGGFSRNLRKEVAKSRKVYFIDLGIRNALVNAFNPLTLRDDAGKLWENYLVIERCKRLKYAGKTSNAWFWRTYDQQEIDYIEESGADLSAFEFKWKSGRKARIPKLWSKTYPNAETHIITPANVAEFLLDHSE